ncbi:MAG: hypothetical protein JZU55_02630 [Afipia sp.]|nr:hypothetical protein [Afipia sp.]
MTDPAVRLSEAQIKLLERGFLGPRPGCNAFPLLQLGDGPSRIDGEQIDAMIRLGYLEAAAASRSETIIGGDAGPYGEIPDVELMLVYSITPAGRAALTQGRGTKP